jgi:TRAP-type mannitol/chloroaromatic compound transport system permease small subunit
MHRTLRAAAWIDRWNARIAGAVAFGTLLMVGLGAFNAIARYLDRGGGMRLSSNAWIELQWYLFSLVFLLGAPYALRRDAHVRVDVFYGRLSARARAWIDLLGGVLLLVPFCALAAWLCWPAVRASFVIRELSPDPGGLPRWPIKIAVPLSFVLLLLQGLSEIAKRVAFLRGHPAAELGLEAESHPDAHEGAA